MPSFIRNPQDFWAGIIFSCAGLAALLISRDYPAGTAGRMGPGYFPTILSGILILIGLVSIVRATIRPGEAIGKFALKEVFLVLLATVLFGVLLRGAGLAIAIIVLVLVSGYASTKFRFVPFLAVAVGMAVFSVLIFITGLGLPMPIIGPWFGF
jgi:putative tricarboxylic transport membrane protein